MIRQITGFGAYRYMDGRVYFLHGNFAPPINYLRQNTGFLVANAYDTRLSGIYKLINVDEAAPDRLKDAQFVDDAVLFRNDPFCRGLMPIFTKYGIMTIENDITFRLANINLRQFIQMIVKDENGEESAELYFEHIENGDQYVLLDENVEYDGIKGNPLTIPAGFMSQLIETAQYIKASQANEVGMNANYNMKRERLSESESDLNEDILRPLPDVMLEERKNDLKDLEDFTGGEVAVEVDFDSVWLKNSVAFDSTMDMLTGENEGEDEADSPDDEPKNEEVETAPVEDTEDKEEVEDNESDSETEETEEAKEADTDGSDTEESGDGSDTVDDTTDDDSTTGDSEPTGDESIVEQVTDAIETVVEAIENIVDNITSTDNKDDEEDKEDKEDEEETDDSSNYA